MAAKKSAKKSTAKKSDSDGTVPGANGKLTRAVWHKGRMYDPKNKRDTADFAKLMEKDKAAQANAERLRKKGVLKGGKSAAADEDEDDTSSASAPIGGGVDGVEAEDVDEEQP